jgi:hypothetical protein
VVFVLIRGQPRGAFILPRRLRGRNAGCEPHRGPPQCAKAAARSRHVDRRLKLTF